MDKAKVSRRAGFLAGGLAAAMLAAPGFGQDNDVEQLRAELELLQLRLEGVEQQQAEAPENGAAVFDTSAFKPGWERVRYDGWMEHGRLEEMSVLIGRGGPIDLYMGVQTAGRLQYLQQSDVVTAAGQSLPGALEPGFQTAWGSIDFLADLYDGALEVYFDLYLSSPTSADKLQGHEGYMIVRSIPGTEGTLLGQLMDVIDVKAGQFEIDFGDYRYRRTDNARSQRNPLVGNHVMDPKTTEIGMEAFNAYESPVNWLVGFGSGDETGGFDPGRGISVHGKLWANLGDLRLAGSTYHVHHADDNASSNHFRTSRGGGVYQGIFTGNAPGQVFVGTGTSVLAFQGDVTWISGDVELYGNVGWVRDRSSAGGREEWYYYGVEGVYYIQPRLHAAARYSGAAAQRLAGSSSSGHVHRVQVGGGYWIFSTVLAKVEYVYQAYDGFSAGETVGGIQAWQDPSFNGVIAEISFGF